MKKAILYSLTVIFVLISGFYTYYYVSNPVTPRNSEISDDEILPTSEKVGDYTIYYSEVGICMERHHIVIMHDFPLITEHQSLNGCFPDAFYYIKIGDEFLTINDAIKEGHITKKDWKNRIH